MPSRLPPQPREQIDRTQRVTFRFEGQEYTGYRGDTVSSALLANGVDILARSFKYHRPRGVFSAANHDSNVLMQGADALNLRADVTPLTPGLDLTAINTAGGVQRDWFRFMQYLSPILPVGFYYKTFHKPRRLFPFWEQVIRNMAGLGRLDRSRTPARQPKRHAYCDVLVVGAGPSGLAAALAAADAGVKVALVDEQLTPGGSLNVEFAGDNQADTVYTNLVERLHAHPQVNLYLGTVASGYYADHWLPLVSADGLVKLRARAVIVATGAVEQPAVFRGNDLPGVMLVSAAQRLIHQFAIKPCERAVILASNPAAYRAALDLVRAGVSVEAIADLGDPEQRGAVVEAVRAQGICIMANTAVYEASATRGRLAAVELRILERDGTLRVEGARRIDCDGLFLSAGWVPAAALLYQAGARMRYAEVPGQFVPDQLPAGVFAAGRVNGVFDLNDRIDDGRAAAAEALAFLDVNRKSALRPGRAGVAHSHAYPIFAHARGKNFIDLDEDLMLKDLERAAAEGFDNIELLKRYSTVGMGPSQGKHANMNAVRVLARINARSIDQTGTTTARPFYHPVPIRALAGRRLRPERRTSLHAWHAAHQAVFMPAGHWLRPKYYGTDRQEVAVAREVSAVREGVGLIDVSTLGKIEIFGPHAGELLDRAYTLRLSNIKLGRTRYALMVDEAGVIIDDGIAARLGEEHFYLTTTTTAAEAVYRELQRQAIEWGLKVDLVNRTGHNAAMNIAGPLTREVLAPLTDIDLSAEAFPFLGVRSGQVAGVQALLMRVGFVGELGYEIHVPAAQANHVWQALMAAGQKQQICPFGVEAQRQLRLEKGHLIVGQDTDGTSTPFDTGMAWAVKFEKPFFVGKRSLQALADRARYQLLGFTLPPGFTGPVPKECHLVIANGEIAGRVTSIGASPSLGKIIGLAMVERRLGEINTLNIRVDGGAMVQAAVVPTPFYDPDNLRQKPEVAESRRGVAA
ncbi:MAG: 2Fe-2S iron-sulfur cluster-binding protein [Gammaproteobacteria bacterium]